MVRTPIIAALVALLPAAAPAWIAQNGLVVEATGPQSFTVPYRGLSGARDFWCAAGDYVVRELNLSPTTRIYRTSPVPRPGGDAMDFSLDPTRDVGRTGLLVLSDEPGLSASFARLQCADPFPYED